MKAENVESIWGNSEETAIKTRSGKIYLVQSPDLDGKEITYEKLAEMPEEFDRISRELCWDLLDELDDLPDV